MKTAFVVSLSATAFEAVAPSGDLEATLAHLAGLGFAGVEIAVRDPEAVDPAQIAALAAQHRLALAAIGTGQAFVDEGLSFTDPDPGRRRQAVERIRLQLDLGKTLNAQVIIGLIRGRGRGGEHAAAEMNWLREALAQCAAYAEQIAAPGLLFEPINRYETRLINSVEEGAAWLRELRLPRVRLLADAFHMNIEDRDLAAALRGAGPLVGHVHLADSNRWAPGQGHTDFAPLFGALAEIGYAGWLSAEILPLPSPRQAAELTAAFLRGKPWA